MSRKVTLLPSIRYNTLRKVKSDTKIQTFSSMPSLKRTTEETFQDSQVLLHSNIIIPEELEDNNDTIGNIIEDNLIDSQIPISIRKCMKSKHSKSIGTNENAGQYCKLATTQQVPSQDVSYLHTYYQNTKSQHINFKTEPTTTIYSDSFLQKKRFIKLPNNVHHQMDQFQLMKGPQFDLSLSELMRKNVDAEGTLSTKQVDLTSMLQDPLQKNLLEKRSTLLSKVVHIQRNSSDRIPPTRIEVQELKEWLAIMINQVQIEKSNMPIQQMVEHIQLIYSTSLKEVIRQCSMQCLERGQLLQQIWDYYVQLMEQIVHSYHDNTKTKEQEQLNEVTRLHKSYGEMVDIQRKQFQQLMQERNETKLQNENFMKTNSYIKTKLITMSGEIKQLHLELDDIKLERENLLKEIIALKSAEEEGNKEDDVQTDPTLAQKESIVQHLLQFRTIGQMNHQPDQLMVHNHKTTVQKFDDLRRRQSNMMFELERIESNSQRSPLLKKTSHFHFEGYNIDTLEIKEDSTQTDPMEFSQFPQINNLINELTDSKEIVKHFDIQNKDIYEKCLIIIKRNDSMYPDQKEQLVSVINQASYQTHTMGNLTKSINEISQQFTRSKQKHMTQYVELRETQEQVKDLEDQLVSNTSDFKSIMKEQNDKISSLSKTNKNLNFQLERVKSATPSQMLEVPNSASRQNRKVTTKSPSNNNQILNSSNPSTSVKNYDDDDEIFQVISIGGTAQVINLERSDYRSNNSKQNSQHIQVRPPQLSASSVRQQNDPPKSPNKNKVQQQRKKSFQGTKNIPSPKQTQSQQEKDIRSQPSMISVQQIVESDLKSDLNRQEEEGDALDQNQFQSDQEQMTMQEQIPIQRQLQSQVQTGSKHSINLIINASDQENMDDQQSAEKIQEDNTQQHDSNLQSNLVSSPPSKFISTQQIKVTQSTESLFQQQKSPISHRKQQSSNQSSQKQLNSKQPSQKQQQSNQSIQRPQQLNQSAQKQEYSPQKNQQRKSQFQQLNKSQASSNQESKVSSKQGSSRQIDSQSIVQSQNDGLNSPKKVTKVSRSPHSRVSSELQIVNQSQTHSRSSRKSSIVSIPIDTDRPIEDVSDSDKDNEQDERDERDDRVENILKRFEQTHKSILKNNRKRFQLSSHNLQSNLYQQQQTKRTKRNYSQNTDPANLLLQEILKTKPNNQKDVISQNSIQKVINIVLNEAVKSEDGYKIPLYVGIYDFFLNKYGFKKVAEKHIRLVLLYIYCHNKDNCKTRNLAQLCYMDKQMDEMSYKLYVDSYKYFTSRDTKQLEHQIKLEHVQEYLQTQLASWLDSEQINQTMVQITTNNKNEFIEYDWLMSEIMTIYLTKKEDYKTSLKVLFEAADLDGNKLLEFSEFKLIYREIHPESFTKQKAIQYFIQYADYMDENTKDKMITLNRFAELAIEQGLFAKARLQKFQEGYDDLFAVWAEEKDLIKYRFIEAKKYRKVKYTFNLLNDYINKKQDQQHEENYDMETLHISFKLLQLQSKRVMLKYETRQVLISLLPVETLMVQQTFKIFDEYSL